MNQDWVWSLDTTIAAAAGLIALGSAAFTYFVTTRYADTHWELKVAPVRVQYAGPPLPVSLDLRNRGTGIAKDVRIAFEVDPLNAFVRGNPSRWISVGGGDAVTFDTAFKWRDIEYGADTSYNRDVAKSPVESARYVIVRWRNPVGFPRSQRMLAPVAPDRPTFADGAFDPGPGPDRAA